MIRPLPERQISVLLLNIFFIFSFSEFVYSFLQFPYKLCNSSAFGQTVTVSVHDKSPSARGGCLLPPRFLTVCAMNAQTCLNCYQIMNLWIYNVSGQSGRKYNREEEKEGILRALTYKPDSASCPSGKEADNTEKAPEESQRSEP